VPQQSSSSPRRASSLAPDLPSARAYALTWPSGSLASRPAPRARNLISVRDLLTNSGMPEEEVDYVLARLSTYRPGVAVRLRSGFGAQTVLGFEGQTVAARADARSADHS
jgi:hypothetical protein